MGDLAKLRELSGAERRVLVVSLIALPLVAAGLALLGFRRTRTVMARWPRRGPARFPTVEGEKAHALRTARVVAIVAGRGPLRTTCLRRSLLLWWLLRRDGIETVIRVGVNRAGGTLNAHAWVEHRNRPLIDADDIARRFEAFAEDFGASPARAS